MNKILSDNEKHVMFEGGTEAPFSGSLLHEVREGNYNCRNCGSLLFDSTTKFDSGSGWPSFTEPKHAEHVKLLEDQSLGMSRTEIRCGHCDVHLGHVFEDGPVQSGGMRYCVNSLSLAFKPNQEV